MCIRDSAEVALWLLDHQMNQRLSEAFGQYFVRLPLRASPHIVCGNALRIDWKTVLSPEKCSYVLGNPPFVGHHLQSPGQKADQMAVLANIQACGVLDYVSNWYIKAADYTTDSSIAVAFVSTNSITQGEQVGLLWSELFSRYRIKIHFAHRTFKWESEARGKAHVHVVIIGFAAYDILNKKIFDYDADLENPTLQVVRNISPYLVEGNDTVLPNRNLPVSDVPAMNYGNKPTDGGFLILDDEEKQILVKEEPQSEKYVRPYIGAQELLDGTRRWCLWLVNIDPKELRDCPQILKRVEEVKLFRLKSKASSTRAYSDYPTLFRQIAQPESNYVAIPAHTPSAKPEV